MLSGKPVAYLCSSSMEPKELIAHAAKISSKKCFVQLFADKPNLAVRLLPAYLNALLREKDCTMRSNSISMEFLLLASTSMNIKNAIRNYGISSSNKFILFATSEKIAKKFKDIGKVKVIKKLKLPLVTEEAAKVAAAELLEE